MVFLIFLFSFFCVKNPFDLLIPGCNYCWTSTSITQENERKKNFETTTTKLKEWRNSKIESKTCATINLIQEGNCFFFSLPFSVCVFFYRENDDSTKNCLHWSTKTKDRIGSDTLVKINGHWGSIWTCVCTIRACVRARKCAQHQQQLIIKWNRWKISRKAAKERSCKWKRHHIKSIIVFN